MADILPFPLGPADDNNIRRLFLLPLVPIVCWLAAFMILGVDILPHGSFATTGDNLIMEGLFLFNRVAREPEDTFIEVILRDNGNPFVCTITIQHRWTWN
ncbi:hypothetical protein D3C86_1612550 [compost metagenome]